MVSGFQQPQAQIVTTIIILTVMDTLLSAVARTVGLMMALGVPT
jgi:hypothetical protein